MSKIFDAQQRIADLLNADPFFNTASAPYTAILQAITQRKGNLQLIVQEKLIRVGAGVIVMLPIITFEGEAERVSLGLKFGVVVTENPVVNQAQPSGSGKPAEAIVEKVCQLLHWKTNAASANPRNQSSLFHIDRNAVRQLQPTPGSEMLLNYVVSINTSITL